MLKNRQLELVEVQTHESKIIFLERSKEIK